MSFRSTTLALDQRKGKIALCTKCRTLFRHPRNASSICPVCDNIVNAYFESDDHFRDYTRINGTKDLKVFKGSLKGRS